MNELIEEAMRAAGLPDALSAHPGVKHFGRLLMTAVAAKCAEFSRDEAAMRLHGGLTFPLEKNPPYIRGQVRGATACAVRIEEEFGIAKHGGPNG
ncbi:MAG: hypothetical protein EOP39_07990 [Rubrivivax sp.]|nr:MAG: hypothetical protein EOP39_07990 [Rubrivivax sp.]